MGRSAKLGLKEHVATAWANCWTAQRYRIFSFSFWHKRPRGRRQLTDPVSHLPLRGASARLAAIFAPLLVALFWVGPAGATAPKVRIKGAAAIEMQLAREDGGALLRGLLADDDGVALGDQMISLRILGENGSEPIHLNRTHTCTGVSREISGSVLQLTTNMRGEYCVHVDLPTGRYRADADWEGSSLIEGAHHTLAFDLARQITQIRFEDVPTIADIDTPFDFTLRLEADQKPLAAATLNVVNEKGVILGKWLTDRSGRARVSIARNRLGAPGPGEVRASFDGNAASAPTANTLPIERRANVYLSAEIPPAGSPEDGIWIPVRVSTSEGLLALSSGSVRASVGETEVGAARVVNGEARVPVSFASDSPTATIDLVYLSDAPWLTPKGPIALSIPLRKKLPWARLFILVSSVALIGWFAMTRKRRSIVDFVPEPKSIEAGVTVLRTSSAPVAAWCGSIIDAHDLTPIPDARISVERSTFEGTHVVAATRSGLDGTFQLDASHTPLASGDEWVIDAPLHAELRRPLPNGSDVRVALVTRRRKVLERFSFWAKQMRWGEKGREPTPLEIRDSAADPQTRAWAQLVSEHAFGEEPVDATREAEVAKAEPPSLTQQSSAENERNGQGADKSGA